MKPKNSSWTDFDYPANDQGVVFSCILDYKLRDYLVAIKDLVGGAKNIVAASKVSENRVIFFLSNRELVDTFMSHHGGFTIECDFIVCWKLTSPTKKIIFSNVSPTIPNHVLEHYIVNKLKIELLSGISILRVNATDPTFRHVMSWRRKIYASGDVDAYSILPKYFDLIYDDQMHRICINFEKFSCFKCKSNGHRAEGCPLNLTLENLRLSEFPIRLDPYVVNRSNVAAKTSVCYPSAPTNSAYSSQSDLSKYVSPVLDEENTPRLDNRLTSADLRHESTPSPSDESDEQFDEMPLINDIYFKYLISPRPWNKKLI